MRMRLSSEGEASVVGAWVHQTEFLHGCGLLCGLQLYFWAWMGLHRRVKFGWSYRFIKGPELGVQVVRGMAVEQKQTSLEGIEL